MENVRGSAPGAAASRCWCRSLTACSAAISLCRTDSVSIFREWTARKFRPALVRTSLRAARIATGSPALLGTRARPRAWSRYERTVRWQNASPEIIPNHRRQTMSKVRFETSGALGLVILANPPLNLFDQELIEDLRTAVDQARRHPLRALLVRADGKNFSGGADVGIFKGKT